MNPLLSSAFSAPIEALLNAVLAQDPVSAAKLSQHDGRAISLECNTPLQWQVFMVVQGQSISIRSIYEPTPEASIRASAGAFSRLLLSGSKTGALFSPDVQISGDTHLIQDLHAVLGGLEIDWEDHFARLFGDVATHQLGQWFSKTRQWSAASRDSLLADVEEYLHEEARLLPTASELGQFSTRIDELKLVVDRIHARQERLLHELQLAAPLSSKQAMLAAAIQSGLSD